jgi:CheY-like chemotaxis protein
MDKLLSRRRILVVEDEMMVLMVIEDMLADMGCASVTAAATVDQALALIDAKSFDAAMLDVNLNGSTSYPVADVLAARGIPFIFATGYNGHGMKQGYGDRPLLTKPFQLDDLIEVFTRLFSERSSVLFDEALPYTYAHGQQERLSSIGKALRPVDSAPHGVDRVNLR